MHNDHRYSNHAVLGPGGGDRHVKQPNIETYRLNSPRRQLCGKENDQWDLLTN